MQIEALEVVLDIKYSISFIEIVLYNLNFF